MASKDIEDIVALLDGCPDAEKSLRGAHLFAVAAIPLVCAVAGTKATLEAAEQGLLDWADAGEVSLLLKGENLDELKAGAALRS